MKNRGYDRILAAGFFILLAGMGILGAVLPEKGFSESENRFLQKKPEFTWAALMDGSFGEKYEAYLSDQFPGRDGWVGVKTLAERLGGKKDANGVYFGKGGYLIEKFEREDLEGEQLERNLEVLAQALGRMVREYGTRHVRVMLVPGASEILEEKLPLYAAPYDQTQVVQKLMKEGNVSEITVQVEEALERRRDEEIYYRTDHHWTPRAAFEGYRGLDGVSGHGTLGTGEVYGVGGEQRLLRDAAGEGAGLAGAGSDSSVSAQRAGEL